MAIQEKLSQAPDEYLEMEMTRPSGRVPLPLVFTEVQKRKEMRDGAMAKAKGNIMGLAEGGYPGDLGLETLMAGPQQMPQTLPSMPEERSELLHWIKGLIKAATQPKEVDPRTRQRRPEDISPLEKRYTEFYTPKDDGAKRDSENKYRVPLETFEQLDKDSKRSFEDHKKMNQETLKKRKNNPSGGGIGGLPSSRGADSFFKALEDSIKGLQGAQGRYMDEMGKNREAYMSALKNDPYAELIKQQQAENSKEQKWGMPLLALASGILSGRNLAQGLGQGAGNMIPVLDRQNQEKRENQRYLQQLMLGQGQMQRGDAKDLFGISQDMAKTGYGMYGDTVEANSKLAQLGLGRERNDIARQSVANQGALLNQRTDSSQLAGIARILAIDTSGIQDPAMAQQIEQMQAAAAKALLASQGWDDGTDPVYDWTNIPGLEPIE